MRHIAKTWVLAAALVAAGSAQAERAVVSIIAGEYYDHYPSLYALNNLQGSGSLTASEALWEKLILANIFATAITPGTLIETDSGLRAMAPIFSMSGTLDSDTREFEVNSIRTTGGTLLTVSALSPNGKKNAMSTGGSLSVTNMRVDLNTQGIYATLTGANGVGARNNVRVWNYGALTGDDTVIPVFNGEIVSRNELSGLSITDDAFNLLAQSLGLTTFGKGFMADITDYGTLSTVIAFEFRGPPPAIPEPSSYVLMGLGLVGLTFASRRARSA